MKILSPAAMTDLTFCMRGIPAVHEHTAICVYHDLAQDEEIYRSLGHQVVLAVPGIAVFLEHPHSEVRIELIQQGVTEHEAWLVETQEDFARLEVRLQTHRQFTFTPKEFRFDHLWAKMFRHNDGGVVQIVWRKTPLYKNIWDKRPTHRPLKKRPAKLC